MKIEAGARCPVTHGIIGWPRWQNLKLSPSPTTTSCSNFPHFPLFVVGVLLIILQHGVHVLKARVAGCLPFTVGYMYTLQRSLLQATVWSCCRNTTYSSLHARVRFWWCLASHAVCGYSMRPDRGFSFTADFATDVYHSRVHACTHEASTSFLVGRSCTVSRDTCIMQCARVHVPHVPPAQFYSIEFHHLSALLQ